MRPRLICAYCRQRRRVCDIELLILAAAEGWREGDPADRFAGLRCGRCASRGGECEYEAPDAADLAKLLALGEAALRGTPRKRHACVPPGPVAGKTRSPPPLPSPAPSRSSATGRVVDVPDDLRQRTMEVYSASAYATLPLVDLRLVGDAGYMPAAAANAVLALALFYLADEIGEDGVGNDDARGSSVGTGSGTSQRTLDAAPGSLSAAECMKWGAACTATATELVQSSLVPVPSLHAAPLDGRSLLWDAVALVHLAFIATFYNPDRRPAEHLFRLAAAAAASTDPAAEGHDGELARRLRWFVYAYDRSGILRSSTGTWIVPDELVADVPLPRPYGAPAAPAVTASMLSAPGAIPVLFPHLDGIAMLAYLHTFRSSPAPDLMDAAASALDLLAARPTPASPPAWTLLPDAPSRFRHAQPEHLLLHLHTLRALCLCPARVADAAALHPWLSSESFVPALDAALAACDRLSSLLASSPTALDHLPCTVWTSTAKLSLLLSMLLRDLPPDQPELRGFVRKRLDGGLRALRGSAGCVPGMEALARAVEDPRDWDGGLEGWPLAERGSFMPGR